MVETTATLGQYTELVENDAGETILKNTQTGTEIKLGDFIEVVGPLGSGFDFETVQSTGDLTDGEPGFYYIGDDDEPIWFDGDTSTN